MTQEIKSVLAGLPFPALVVGDNRGIVAWNEPALALFGPSLEGRFFITLIRQPDVLKALSKAEEGVQTEATYVARHGDTELTYTARVYPVTLDKKRHVMCIFRDRSEDQAVDKMRRDFIANLSHELKSPLTAISGFIETLQGPAKSDLTAQERFLTMMDQEAGRMRRLVDDLLVLSRVEANERIRPRDMGDLGVLVRDTVRVLSDLAARNSIELTLNLPQDPIEIPHDPDQLRQVFTNLVENAIKYGGGGERVEVSVSAPIYQPVLGSEGVCCEVRDWGAGIDERHIPRLTERFYRIDGHRSREVGGTGLGLAIVKHIVLRHRGKFRIHSAKGEGSRFSIFLPTSSA